MKNKIQKLKCKKVRYKVPLRGSSPKLALDLWSRITWWQLRRGYIIYILIFTNIFFKKRNGNEKSILSENDFFIFLKGLF
jgi:hypothetical protein